jgi:diguanylate cyclase
VYLTRIHWRTHEQEVRVAANTDPGYLYIPEAIKIDYSDAVCRYVLEGGPTATDDVPRTFPDSDLARFLKLRSFVSVPIELEDGEVFGTLCGASTEPVRLDQRQLEEMRSAARVIAHWLSRNQARIPTASA